MSAGVAGPGGIRQVACQTNEEDRSIESQTEEVSRADKAMQFYLGDDTDFLESLKAAAARTGAGG